MKVQVQYTATHQGQVTVDIDEDALEEYRKRSDLPEDIEPRLLVQDFLETAHDRPHYWENGTIRDSDHDVDAVIILPEAGLVHRWTLSGPSCGARLRALVTTRDPNAVTCPDCQTATGTASLAAFRDILSGVPDDQEDGG